MQTRVGQLEYQKRSISTFDELIAYEEKLIEDAQLRLDGLTIVRDMMKKDYGLCAMVVAEAREQLKKSDDPDDVALATGTMPGQPASPVNGSDCSDEAFWKKLRLMFGVTSDAEITNEELAQRVMAAAPPASSMVGALAAAGPAMAKLVDQPVAVPTPAAVATPHEKQARAAGVQVVLG